MKRVISLSLVVTGTILITLAACPLPYHPAQDVVALPVAEIAGCYDINYLGLGRLLRRTRERVRLLTEVGTADFEKGAYLVRLVPTPAENPYGFSYWKVVSPGHIAVIFTNGFSSIKMQLDVYSQELRGVAEERSDVVTLFNPRWRMLLQRIACS